MNIHDDTPVMRFLKSLLRPFVMFFFYCLLYIIKEKRLKNLLLLWGLTVPVLCIGLKLATFLL